MSDAPAVKAHWKIRKPTVTGTDGMVASQHYLASQAGQAVLAAGGNAIDAAISTGLMLSVVEPWMSGLGGGGYMLIYSAARDEVFQIEFGMQAPQAAMPTDYPLAPGQISASDAFNWPKVEQDRNVHGPLAIAVPGYLRGIELALKRFGTQSLAELIEPAKRQAQLGLPIDWFACQKISQFARGLRTYEATRNLYLQDGLPPAADSEGLITYLPLPGLAETLATLQQEGADAIYRGSLTQSIVQELQAAGSKISATDLEQYEAIVSSPLSGRFREHQLYTAGSLTAGPSLLEALTHYGQTAIPEASNSTSFVAMAKALQTTYQNRLENLGEGATDGSTTHICTADRHGNVVSFTQTIMSAFGARIHLPTTGFLMNNGMMWFDPRPDGPNSVVGGRRPLCNMCPTLGRSPDGSWFAVGACGGRKIFPSIFQLIIFLTDYGLSLEDAIHQGRIDVSGTDLVTLMDNLPLSTIEALEHTFASTRIRPNDVSPNFFALPQIITRSPKGLLEGGCFIPSPHALVASIA
jgi:gamma-glutamyltranspeptidase/glutathione hydrolase